MKNTHLAGIIPVANLKSEFELKTPEILLPISSDFTAIQKSVFECALAGCNTIWIVANDDLAPIVKQVVGDWTYDPVYYNRMSKFKSEQRKEIPIYYVPIHQKTAPVAILMDGQFCMVSIRLGEWHIISLTG